MIPEELLEAFKATLLTGGYNLLLGAGVSLDSQNGLGESVRSGEKLRQDLCALKGVRNSTTLPRVYSLLTDHERQVELVERYSNCQPAASLDPLPRFLWRRLFTFNIDDVLETLYPRTAGAKQTLVPLNFDASFEPTPDRRELHAIHLHGWVGQRESGFVFSYTEYARVMTTMNPWMHLLAEILATESFIIAGTSLNEVDLEYYLSYRSEATPRRGRGPSLLIEPHPDAATEADCKRYGLTLVKATFAEFLAWLQKQFPSPPSLSDLIVPDVSGLFPDKSLSSQLLRFFADFRLVTTGDQPRSPLPSPFLYGREPQKEDLDQHLDIPRADTGLIQTDVERMLSNVDPDEPKLLVVLDDAGTGKSTVIHRVGHDLASRGQTVMAVHTLSRIDVKNAAKCIASATSPIILLVDGLADHAEQILDLLLDDQTKERLVVLAAERSYRQEYIDIVFGDVHRVNKFLQPLNQPERRQLIELFRQYGLVGDPRALRDAPGYAAKLRGEPVAIAVCRILNDFRPLDAIVESLWTETPQGHRWTYLCIALAQHCHVAGLRHSILQSISGLRSSLASLFTTAVPLSLTENLDDTEYVLTLNAVIGERILQRAIGKDKSGLLDAFTAVAMGIAPYVNRRAIMSRSPEARLAGRLFDADKIVTPLLGSIAEQFYVACQKDWAWNSRYWEQRALLVAVAELDTAIQYARHAVAIEFHPFPLTTLGKLLLRQMESDPASRDSIFNEAFEKLSTAIHREALRSRVRIHPYATIFSGAARFLDLGGLLSPSQHATLTAHVADARCYFGRDAELQAALTRLDRLT